MKKRLFAAAMAVVMVASLAGCGKKVKVDLCEYKGIALKSITDEEFQEKLDADITNYFTENKEVEVAASGDTCNINYCGKLDGVAFDGGTDDSESGTNLVLGSGSFIPGFEDGLIGAKTGEKLDLNLTFPEEYPNNPDLAGKAVVFEVTVNKITRPTVLELTDELVNEKLGYSSVDAYYKEYREALNKSSYNEQLGEYLSENCTVTNLPEDEVEDYRKSVYDYAEAMVQYYASMYGMSEELILYYMLGFESYDALNEYCLEGAKQNVTYQNIIKAIADKEGIKVSDADYQEKGLAYAKQYSYDTLEAMEEKVGKDTVMDSIIMDMTLEFLINNATIFEQ